MPMRVNHDTVRAQNDKCESVAITSATKRLLHIGEGIFRWVVQATLRVRISSPDRADDDTQAYC